MGSVGTYLSIPDFSAFFCYCCLGALVGQAFLIFVSTFSVKVFDTEKKEEGADEQLYEAPKATKSDSSNTRLPVAEKVNCT